ncbi:MAG: SDR family oxidoreductase [candidate division Zixibacteria bacterium]|nr:SDR family oxidoreductase [candidate division Zixibacteria bacterium]
MQKVLVAGASGYLGRYLIKELKKQGYSIRALVRNSKKIEDLKEHIDEIFEDEVTKPDTLAGVCEDIDFVISSIGITRQKDGLTYMDVDYQGNKNLLEQAKKNNISKFIYISVINAHLMKDLKMIRAKELFVSELKESGLDYVVVRPTGFFSDMLEFLKMAQKGRVSLFGNGQNKINPIHGADLAKVCVESLDSQNKEINVGGPEIFTFREIGELAFKVLDRKVKISTFPLWMIQIILPLIRIFFSSKTYGPLEFMMAIMTMDVIGDLYGKEKLCDCFKQNVG